MNGRNGGRIVVVDDEKLKRVTLEAQLRQAGHDVAAFDNPFPALAWMDRNPCDVAITDLRMPSMDGLAFLREVRKRDSSIQVILMTAYGTVQTAVEALKAGAVDYLTKPFETDELLVRLGRVLELRRLRAKAAMSPDGFAGEPGFHGMILTSGSMRRVVELVQSIADNPATVLIIGETGTGKGMVARAVHLAGPRREAPFVKLGCAQLGRDVLESELFGHEAGAFTSALKLRHGRFELADGGTLFLDDIDDIPLESQVKLLHVLEDRAFTRVGGEKSIQVNVRILCATKKNLAQLVQEGKFRQDLYYRLKVVEIDLPPLRERKEDIIALVGHFLPLYASRAGKPVGRLSPEALGLLERYDWPGNVRELEHVVERAVAICRSPLVEPADLPEEIRGRSAARQVCTLNLAAVESIPLEGTLDQIEREILHWALTKSGGNQSRAADLLQIPRTTLRDRLDRIARLAPPAAEDSADLASKPAPPPSP